MDERVVMIIFDESKVEDNNALHRSLNLNPRFTDWFHYIGGMYLVHTDYTHQEISNIIHPHISNSRFIITTWDPLDGFWASLPDDAWDWLDKYGYGKSLPE